MISSATFHVITTELVVGSFAMAGVCFLIKALQYFQPLKSEKASMVTDYAGHFALGFGLIATPFAIATGISSSPGSDLSSPLLVNKMFLSMTALGISVAVLYSRLKIGNKIWLAKSNALIQSSSGMAASGLMLATASAGGKYTRGESLLDILTPPYETILLIPFWLSSIILVAGAVSVVLALSAISKQSSIQH